MRYMIPDYTRDALDRWAQCGLMPGGFVRSVLCNDLSGACMRADMSNRSMLFEIVQYVYNELPSDCWGSEEKVDAWEKRFAPAEVAP